jgi:hypothetical protein
LRIIVSAAGDAPLDISFNQANSRTSLPIRLIRYGIPYTGET